MELEMTPGFATHKAFQRLAAIGLIAAMVLFVLNFKGAEHPLLGHLPDSERHFRTDHPSKPTFLDLSGTSVTDQDFSAVGELPSIRWLVLRDTGLTDAAMRHVVRLQGLTDLDLSGTPVGGPGLEHVANLPNLQRLYLANTNVDARGLSALRHAGQLLTLDLHGVPMTEAHAKAVAQIPSLWSVTLSARDAAGPAGQKLEALRPDLMVFAAGARGDGHR